MNTPDGWIKMTERKPTKKDGTIWAYYSDGSITTFKDVCIELGATHWKPAVLPAPPKKELTQREKDEEAYQLWFCRPAGHDEMSLEVAWHAALAWERKQNTEDFKALEGSGLCFVGNQKGEHLKAFANLRRRCGLDT